MSDKSKKQSAEKAGAGGVRGSQGQMEGGAAVHGEQMAASNLIYEINNVSQIEFRNRNTLPEF